jgi:hypothetical protein
MPPDLCACRKVILVIMHTIGHSITSLGAEAASLVGA